LCQAASRFLYFTPTMTANCPPRPDLDELRRRLSGHPGHGLGQSVGQLRRFMSHCPDGVAEAIAGLPRES